MAGCVRPSLRAVSVMLPVSMTEISDRSILTSRLIRFMGARSMVPVDRPKSLHAIFMRPRWRRSAERAGPLARCNVRLPTDEPGSRSGDEWMSEVSIANAAKGGGEGSDPFAGGPLARRPFGDLSVVSRLSDAACDRVTPKPPT